MFHISKITTFKSAYSTFSPHYIIQYGTIFWPNSSGSGEIFILKQKLVRIRIGAKPVTSCI
jgi:hypothetical protein